MPSTDDQRPIKRLRASLACQECRSRKLACDGCRPCARCRQDGRECNEVAVTGRSPLTRKRMTELESRIAVQERLWNAIFPLLPLEDAADRAAANGLDVTIQEALSLHGRGSAPTVDHIDVIPTQESRQQSAYPLTRPPSPRNEFSLQNAIVLATTTQNPSNGYHEGHTPHDQVAGPLDGMGSNAGIDAASESGGGAGYIGLSSGATLLHAIRRLAPQEIVPSPLSNWNAFGLMESQFPSISSMGLPSAKDDSQAILSLGPAKKLPPAAEFKPLVDAYFRYFHPLTPIVHEPTVRAQLMGAVPLPRNSGNRVLFYMIFAMGSFDLALTAEDDNGYKYYEIARHAYREEVMEEGSLQLVQGLAIMANYLQRSNKPNAGFVCLGVAIRMAIALGIHASATGGKLTALDSETRTRLWWGLVTLEAGCCSTFGRPHALGFSSLLAVRLPTNCDDESLTVSDETIPPAAQHVTLYTALIIQARLAKTTFGLQDRISKSLPSPRVEQIRWCGQSFQGDLLSFPAFMQTAGPGPYRLARAIQSWRARYLRSVMYRPVLLSAAWSPSWRNGRDKTVYEIIETCRTLALENLRDISDFRRCEADPHRGAEWYILYFGFQAALTLLLSIVWEPDHASVGTWRSAISETMQWTRQLRSVQQLATSYATIMENVLNAKMPVMPQTIPEPYAGRAQDTGEDEACDVAFDFERYLLEIRGLPDADANDQFVGRSSYARDGFTEIDQLWDFGSL